MRHADAGFIAPDGPEREKALRVVDSQGFWILVALQGFEPRTCGL